MHLHEIQTREVEDTTHYFPEWGSIEYLCLALAGEVGEAANDIKKWSRGSITRDEVEERLASELPDILIYLVMLAHEANVDLEEAYKEKKAFNEQRFRNK